MIRACVGLLLLLFWISSNSSAQQAPSIGYMFPPGGQTGSTIDVVLGGYDWTPDMELLVRDTQIQLEITGTPGPVIVPEPPYWFGKKARRGPFMLPRETPANLKLPATLKPGIYRWQAANANGVTSFGKFVVSNGLEIIENRDRQVPQQLPSLPVTVSGQILKIEEVDEFYFTAPATGPMTCEIIAVAIGSPLTAVVEIRDGSDRLIADAADTASRDLKFTFAVEAGQKYTARVYDVDFRGNRSFVYRLSLTPGPSLVTTMPAFVKQDSTQDVEFIGYGIKTGSAKLESIIQKIQVHADVQAAFVGEVEVVGGTKLRYEIPISDIPEVVEQQSDTDFKKTIQELSGPVGVTGVLSQRYGTDRYRASGSRGDVWAIDVLAEAIGSPLDVSLAIVNEAGVELKRVDDVAGTTDVRVEFKLPADGAYDLIVGDTSGTSGRAVSVYRLAVHKATPGFRLSTPERLAVPINGSAVLAVKAERIGGFTGAIAISIDGLPAEVSIPAGSEIPEKKNDVKLKISAPAGVGTVARMVTLTGSAVIAEKSVTHSPEATLLAITMKPPFSIDAEGKNDVTKWPRGTTYPAPVLVERDETFKGDIILEMAAKQGRHRQGIRGPEMTITPYQKRILYPVFLPEWLETTRTSRMVVNGVTKVADPAGRIRYSSSKLVTRLGFLPTGAMLKIESPLKELDLTSKSEFEYPINVLRASGLSGAITLELVRNSASAEVFTAEAVSISESTTVATLKLNRVPDVAVARALPLRIRATGNWNAYPVIAETTLIVISNKAVPRKVAMP